MEYFRVPPRWLFVKITDEAGNVGWGEATLEGHSQAVEGCLDAWFERYTGMEADDIEHIWQTSWRTSFYRGGPVFMSALAGIDIALWDLKGTLTTPRSGFGMMLTDSKARKLGVPICAYELYGVELDAVILGDVQSSPGDILMRHARSTTWWQSP